MTTERAPELTDRERLREIQHGMVEARITFRELMDKMQQLADELGDMANEACARRAPAVLERRERVFIPASDVPPDSAWQPQPDRPAV